MSSSDLKEELLTRRNHLVQHADDVAVIVDRFLETEEPADEHLLTAKLACVVTDVAKIIKHICVPERDLKREEPTMRKITVQDIQIIVRPLAETTPLRGNLCNTGDPNMDLVCETEVRRRQDEGDEWAWCSVAMRCSYKEILSTISVLPCYSGSTLENFKRTPSYNDLLDDCLEKLNDQLKQIEEDFVTLRPLSLN